jgi:predicted nucleic acid-binding protein
VIVVDTNVLSELSKERPDPVVAAWFLGQDPSSLATTSVSLAEVLYGLELLPQGKRRERLSELSRVIFEDALSGRVLPFDDAAARHYARLLAEKRRRGSPMAPLDAQIAAIAVAGGAAAATRNVTDFEHCGITVVNPWIVSR